MTDANPRNPASPLALRLALSLAIAGAVFVVFAPALGGEFLNFDDDRNLLDNRHFRGLGGRELAWMFSTNWMGPYQPLSWLSLALDHAWFGLDAGAFHRTNLVLHALGAVAAFALARALLSRWSCIPPGNASPPGHLRCSPNAVTWAAAGAALFFALHPLRVESVAWITERRDVLSGLFSLLALKAWIGHADPAHSAEPRSSAPGTPPPPRLTPRLTPTAIGVLGSALAAAAFFLSVDRGSSTRLALRGPGLAGLAIGSAALVAAAVAVSRSGRKTGPSTARYLTVLFWFCAALLSKGTTVVLPALLVVLDLYPLRRRPSPWLLLEKLPLFTLSLVFSVLAVWGQSRGADTIATLEDHGPLERALQSFYGLWYYPWRTLLPVGLSPLYELPARIEPVARFWLPAFGVVVAAIAAWVLRRRAPALSACGAAFALAISPVVGLTQVGPQLVADRYSYLACLPFALLFGGALLSAAVRAGRAAPLPALLGALWLASLGGLARDYTGAWTSSERLWSRAIEVDPRSAVAHFGLGTTQARAAEERTELDQRRDGFARADEQLARAVELFEDHPRVDPRAAAGLGRVRSQRAQLEPERRAEFLADAARLSELAYAQAQTREQVLPEYRFALGLDLLAVGRGAEAQDHLVAYTQLEPGDLRGWVALAGAQEALGRTQAAIQTWRRVLELAPGHRRAARRLEALGH